MKQLRKHSVGLAVLVAVMVGGCGGGVMTLLAALGIIKLHDVYADIKDSVTEDPNDTLTLLMDGYVVRTDVPDQRGRLTLDGLPEGRFLISLVSQDRRRGWHEVVDTRASSVPVEVNPITGGVVSGTVVRETTGGGEVAAANALVAAFYEGAEKIAGGSAPLALGSDNVEYVLAICDASGQFTLGPLRYGSWLVGAVLPGYAADCRRVQVSSGSDIAGMRLKLPVDSGASTGEVRGTVARKGSGQPLQDALARADLKTPLVPRISSEAQQSVAASLGQNLPADRWFSVPFVPTVSGADGGYDMELPAGAARLWAYHYGFKGAYADIEVDRDRVQKRDFELESR
ncbi:MAG: hypothetical protein H5T86_12765 [Armatimonadetes bacterium]|nr:hypothetical protein [Armatimonadota bacterium]